MCQGPRTSWSGTAARQARASGAGESMRAAAAPARTQLTGALLLNLGAASSAAPNKLVGSTPSSICQMAALESVSFRFALSMDGTIPTCVGELADLTSMDYSAAGEISGTIPRGFCELTKLESLQFQCTGGLTGA